MTGDPIDAHLAAALERLAPGPIAVGLSGGADSVVLLHALAQQPAVRQRGLRAIHIDHGLHADSADWAAQAQALAASLDVPCVVLRVAVERNGGTGPEAAARAARYAAWAGELAAGEILALAHHRDDQVETLLLKLLRGSSAEGLGAMRPWRALAAGWLWRPLLDLPREALAVHARTHALACVDDPSNTDQRMDRNYLRHRVLPLLRDRWPRCDAVIARSADWQRANAEYLANEVEKATATVVGLDPATLRIEAWLALPDALRDPVLRAWLRRLALPQPTHAQALEALRQMQTAARESAPCVRWPGVELRRYRDLLHAMAPQPALPAGWSMPFDGSPVKLPAGLGTFQLQGHIDPAALVGWTLRFRRGGERIQLVGEPIHRELRDLFQQHGIPPWLRGRLPILVNSSGEPIAVADLWWSALAEPAGLASDVRVIWRSGADVPATTPASPP